MSFNRPTLSELRARVSADLAARLNLSQLLSRSVLQGLANSEAGVAHLLYGGLDWVKRQQYPQSADAEGLLRWSELGNVPRLQAQFAQGPATFSGQVGAPIPVNSQVRRSDGLLYKTRSAATIGASGTVDVTLRALEAGLAYNSAAGMSLSLSSTLPGIQSSATVTGGGIVGGSDAESDEALRERVLARFRAPVRGGSRSDYVFWAREVPGVTRAWCYPQTPQIGCVSVTFTRDDDPAGPIPTEGQVEDVQEALDEKRPVTAELFVFAPIAYPVDFAIAVTPDTAEVRAAVEASLRDLFRREAEPGGTLLLSHLEEAIAVATGETDHVLSNPTADVVAPFGRLPVPGTFSFIP